MSLEEKYKEMNLSLIERKIAALQELSRMLAGMNDISNLSKMVIENGASVEEANYLLNEIKIANTTNDYLRKTFGEDSSVSFSTVLMVKANYYELESLRNISHDTLTERNTYVVEIDTYLEEGVKNDLIEKYLTAAEEIGADTIHFYGIC